MGFYAWIALVCAVIQGSASAVYLYDRYKQKGSQLTQQTDRMNAFLAKLRPWLPTVICVCVIGYTVCGAALLFTYRNSLSQARRVAVEAVEATSQSCDLHGEIVFLSLISDNPPGHGTAFIFTVEVENRGERPSRAGHWKLMVFFPNDSKGVEIRKALFKSGTLRWTTPNGEQGFYYADDDLDLKVGENPIEPGALKTGIARFFLPGFDRASIPDGTSWRLSFDDIRGTNIVCTGLTNYTAKLRLEASQGLRVFPGLQRQTNQPH